MTPNSEPAVAAPREGLRWWQIVAAGALLACYFVAATSAVADKSATFDEPFHIAGGYSYWKFHDFRIQPENGNLPQRWAALPLLFGECQFPSRETPAWRFSQKETFAPEFLYGEGNDARAMLLRSRAMIALVGVTLGGLVFAWTRRLLGVAAAFVSLTIYVLCPTMLACGGLATSDMAAALFFTAAVGCIWMVLHRVTWQTLLVSSLVMAGLFVSKFSAPLVVVMGLVLVAVQLASQRPLVVSWGERVWEIRKRHLRVGADAAVIALHVLVAWIVIWACYDFRFEMLAGAGAAEQGDAPAMAGVPQYPWSRMAPHYGGQIDRMICELRDLHVLPEAYLYGFAVTHYFSYGRGAFLNGQFSTTGWPQFFPYCLAVKTPLTLFVLMALGAAALVRCWRGGERSGHKRRERLVESLYRAAPLWSLFIVYWAAAIQSHLNIGQRHLLPTYPPMIMLAGAAALWLERCAPSKTPAAGDSGMRERLKARRSPALAAVTLGCIGLFGFESAWHWPNYLAYFNVVVGGSGHAYRHLVDSSLDWGQELPALKVWLEREGLDKSADSVYLSYFGTASPGYYGIEATRLPWFWQPPRVNCKPGVLPLRPGAYCISATMLQQVYSPFPLRWDLSYEQTYHKLHSNLKAYDSIASDAEARKKLLSQSGGEDAWARSFEVFEYVRFARLCNYLRQREPDAEINDSILIYRLSAADLRRALDGPAKMGE